MFKEMPVCAHRMRERDRNGVGEGGREEEGGREREEREREKHPKEGRKSPLKAM